MPANAPGFSSTSTTEPKPLDHLRLGLVPERDIFEQRRRYRALAGYLSQRLGQPVDLVTLGSYQQILHDFRNKQVDAAFLGSFVAVLAVDRFGAVVTVKPELVGGVSTYRGVIFVPEKSPLKSLDDLAGRNIVMVRATTAGALFPADELNRRGLLAGPRAVNIAWVGTHDDAILDVLDGRVDAGAAKDLRLDQIQREHPDKPLRRLAVSAPVPESALTIRADLAATLGPRLSAVLLNMSSDPDGRAVLAGLGAQRFVPCTMDQFRPIYDMAAETASVWNVLGIDGPPPALKPVPTRASSGANPN
jgi:phosphonate transport system substrate-binding protein